MKKLLLLTLLAASCCRQPQEIADSIKLLESKEYTLQESIQQLKLIKSELSAKIDNLKSDHEVLTAMKAGKSISYILKIKGEQSRFSLDIGEHMKDAMNAFDFEIPVSKEFYEEQEIGENVSKSFRGGSFILNGSFGSFNLTVKEKRIVINE